MDFVKKNIAKWACALVLLVVGILCIVAGAASDGQTAGSAYEGISITIGVALLVISSLVLILALVASILSKGDTKFGVAAIGVSTTLALGIFFIANKGLGGELIWLFLNFVPYVLIVVGAIVACDVILTLIFGIIKKQQVKALIIATVISVLFAAVAIILGALMIGDDPVIAKNTQLIIFGIIIVIFAVLAALATFITMPTKKNNDNVVDAEVKDAE